MATERRDFTEEEILRAWNKADTIPGKDPDKWRKDYAGAWMWWPKYGDTSSVYGWEVDHIKPLAKNGTYDKNNLIAVQWENNRHKSDNYPEWETMVSHNGVRNIGKIQSWHIEK